MELEEVDVVIDPDGRVHLQVRGAKGKACLEVTRRLEELLGDRIEQRDMTPEALDETKRSSSEERDLRHGGS